MRTAIAHPNIAFIKYWGNREDALCLPANGSISMNLAGLETRTSVAFDPSLAADEFVLQGERQSGAVLGRVAAHLDLLRARAGVAWKARVESANDFPAGTGLASSASGFAALTVAAATALGLDLSEKELSALARRGSGSACRSIPAGFVEWHVAGGDADSHAETIAPQDHWALVDLIAIVSAGHKKIGSSAGHKLAATSPMQTARIADTPRRLDVCRRALREKDFPALAGIIEEDTRMMHAVMLTSNPSLAYLEEATYGLMSAIPAWRADGLPVAYTIDAGPNIHCICLAEAAEAVRKRLESQPGVIRLLTAKPGGGARLVDC
jgi:diphosphomevalonate decarboxylase